MNDTLLEMEPLVPALILVARGQIEGYRERGLWIVGHELRQQGLPMMVGLDLRAGLNTALDRGLVWMPSAATSGPAVVRLTDRGKKVVARSRAVRQMAEPIQAIVATLLQQP